MFSGGFLGVDIFFVISGYLITSILLKEIESGQFSITHFYERRARRILPALFLVMTVSIPFAWYWLIPTDMLDFAQSYSAISLFASNFLFWKESGYFEVASELKPMLHTWSLAVEEQFYVFLPLLLLFLWRFGKTVSVIVLALLAAISLLIAQWASSNSPSSAFYLLPFRWWELALGSLAAYYMYKRRGDVTGSSLNQILSGVGALLIVVSLFAFDKHTLWPSFYTLLPVVGTCMVILFCNTETLLGKILGSRILVGLGLVSYSAYLWHHPIFSLLQHRLANELTMLYQIFLVILIFVLAYLSWRFVEQPFRAKNRIGRRKIFLFGVFGSILIMLFGIMGHLTNGYTWRYDNILDIRTTSFPKIDNGWCFYSVDTLPSLKVGIEGQECSLGHKGARLKGLLIGDSFAGQYEPFWHKLGNSLSIEINSVTTNWCFPSISSEFSGPITSPAYKQCMLNRSFLKEHAKSYDVVILGGDWATVSTEKHMQGVGALIQWLSTQVKLIVIMPSPKLFDKNVNALYVRSVLLEQSFNISDVSTAEDLKAQRAHQQMSEFTDDLSNIIIIRREDIFEGDVTGENIPYSSDGRHLSIYGSEKAYDNYVSSKAYEILVERFEYQNNQ